MKNISILNCKVNDMVKKIRPKKRKIIVAGSRPKRLCEPVETTKP